MPQLWGTGSLSVGKGAAGREGGKFGVSPGRTEGQWGERYPPGVARGAWGFIFFLHGSRTPIIIIIMTRYNSLPKGGEGGQQGRLSPLLPMSPLFLESSRCSRGLAPVLFAPSQAQLIFFPPSLSRQALQAPGSDSRCRDGFHHAHTSASPKDPTRPPPFPGPPPVI